MNFFKKVLGLGKLSLRQQAQALCMQGTFFKVSGDTRNVIYKNCQISFETEQNQKGQIQYLITFINQEKQQQSKNQSQSYAFPINQSMGIVTFQMKKGGVQYQCFEWVLQDQEQHVGFYTSPQNKMQIVQIINKILKQITPYQQAPQIAQVTGIPIYKSQIKKIQQQKSKILIQKQNKQQQQRSQSVDQIIQQQALKQKNKLVHSASLFTHVHNRAPARQLVNSNIVLIICQGNQKGQAWIKIINSKGQTLIQTRITNGLMYQINQQQGYLKWLQIQQSGNSKVIQVNFNQRPDVTLSVKFAIIQVLYQSNTGRKLTDAIAEDQVSYLKRMQKKVNVQQLQKVKIVNTFNDKTQIQLQQTPKFVHKNSKAQKGLQAYRALYQSKSKNINVATLGHMIQMLKISGDDQIKSMGAKQVFDNKKNKIQVQQVITFDNDQKAIINDNNGTLHFYDIQKQKIINKFSPSSKGIQSFCPQFKLVQNNSFKTIKAVSSNSIYQIDPREDLQSKGSVNCKTYTTSPQFNRITVDTKGRFAASSVNGQIRLFNQVGKNANCKYPGLGDPVLHLESTKDGKWLLATYQKYIILIPTQTQDQINLYQNKIKINQRPRPIKLSIKLQHLQHFKVKQVKMKPAKFDQQKNKKQMYIVSGFDQYVVVWNLAKVLRGNNDYKFINVQGQLVQADFVFDHVNKMITTTSNGITIKQNKIMK